MTGRWTKWQISRAIESGKPLPPSLVRKLRKDPESRQFYEASLAMAARLQRDAAKIVRQEQERLGDATPLHIAQTRQTPAAQPRVGTPRRLSLALAVVILAAVVGAWIWWRSPSARPRGRSSEEVAQAQDLQELMEIARQIEETMDRVATREAPRLREGVARSGEALRKPIVREIANIKADTRRILQRLFWLPHSEGDSPGPDSQADPPPPSSTGRGSPHSPEEHLLAGLQTPTKVPL